MDKIRSVCLLCRHNKIPILHLLISLFSLLKWGEKSVFKGCWLPLPILLKKKESCVQLQTFSFISLPLRAIWLSLQMKCSICFDLNQPHHNYCHISFVAVVLLTESKLIINQISSHYCPWSICWLMDPGQSRSMGGCFGFLYLLHTQYVFY